MNWFTEVTVAAIWLRVVGGVVALLAVVGLATGGDVATEDELPPAPPVATAIPSPPPVDPAADPDPTPTEEPTPELPTPTPTQEPTTEPETTPTEETTVSDPSETTEGTDQ